MRHKQIADRPRMAAMLIETGKEIVKILPELAASPTH
jgi:hypothetical protein